MQQRTFGAVNFEKYGRQTRKAKFLEEMNGVIPWEELVEAVEPYYPKPSGAGRRPVGIERMLRIHFLQHWFSLSDPGVEEALYDSRAMREFVGVDLGEERVPDETTICKFRHLLERHELGKELFRGSLTGEGVWLWQVFTLVGGGGQARVGRRAASTTGATLPVTLNPARRPLTEEEGSMKTMILAAVLAVALMLAGCGGGSKGGAGAGMPSTQTPTTPRPTVRVVPLSVPGEPETPAVPVEIPDNTVRINPGQTREVSVGGRSVSVRCPSGGASCHVGVHEGGLWYRLDGAVPFALASLPSTPTPTTPPTRVIEYPLVSWGELPASIDRMDHVTQIGSSDFPGSSCNGGVADCRTLIKGLLQYASEYGWEDSPAPVKRFSVRENRPGEDFYRIIPGFDDSPKIRDGWRRLEGGWLDNSIFFVERGPRTNSVDGHWFPSGPTYFDGIDTFYRMTSMGIRDTNPVVGRYYGNAIDSTGNGLDFSLTYKTGATGGQIDMTLFPGLTYAEVTWSNVPVDDNGGFDNGVRFPDKKMIDAGYSEIKVPHRLEGSFYQGGEVGGVFVYQANQVPEEGSEPLRTFISGAFGGKLVPASP